MKSTKITGLLFLLLVFFGYINAQSIFDNVDTVKYPYYLWNTEVIENCNTAATADYMTSEERNVIWLSNLARFDGNLFAKTFLKNYINSNEIVSSRYTKSLFSDLKKTSNLPPLLPDHNIFELGKSHAEKSGQKGKIGHQGFSQRANKSRHSKFSENCAYGNSTAIDIVMQLLIDEGVESLGHRKNILNPKTTHTAVSIQPHKTEQFVCVIEYGG